MAGNHFLPMFLLGMFMMIAAGCGMDNKAPAKPQSRAMTYLLFPKNRDGALKRAILADGVELYGNAPFEYYEGNEVRKIPRSEVTLTPPRSDEELKYYVSGLNDEISKWGENTEFEQVLFYNSPEHIHVRIRLKSGKIIGSFYTVKEDLVPENCFVETVMYR